MHNTMKYRASLPMMAATTAISLVVVLRLVQIHQWIACMYEGLAAGSMFFLFVYLRKALRSLDKLPSAPEGNKGRTIIWICELTVATIMFFAAFAMLTLVRELSHRGL